jgi:hypothetical protein
MNQLQVSALANYFQPAPPAKYWARWEYSPSDWQRLDQLDWGLAQKRFRLRALFAAVGALPLLAGIVLLLLGQFHLDDTVQVVLFVLAVGLEIAGLLPLLLVLPPYRQAKVRHLARQSGLPTVIIGELSAPPIQNQGLWQGRQYVPLQQFMVVDLKEAAVMPGTPSVLRLRRKYQSFQTTSSDGEQSRTAAWSETLLIPVPFGREAEAQWLVERLRRETIQAGK